MALWTLLLFSAGWAGLFLYYYQKQNAGIRLGGPISKPKAYWLGLTTFSYFFLPWWIYCCSFCSEGRLISLWMGSLLGFRAGFQVIQMFWIKKWSPPMGMTFNVVFAGILICQAFALNHILSSFLAAMWSLMMLTDTLFAWQFFKIVGKQTQGPKAIWYADESPVFRIVNHQTRLANLVFTIWVAIGAAAVVAEWLP